MLMARGEPLDIPLMPQWSSHKPAGCPQNVCFQDCAHCNGLAHLLKGLVPGGHSFAEHGAHP